ncbi:MAG: alpha/beta hydrolase [Oceanospirillaceae bacterium]|nr:alpha/beta hydrolase [Oceanospirillaceae bacterium]
MAPTLARFEPAKAAAEPAQSWVLLRGLVREHRHWGSFAQGLADRLQATVYCPDLPGNGTRCREPSPLSLRTALEAIREPLQHQGAVNLLGLSMGGMVAALWALHHPHEVRRLVLINSSFGDLSPPWRRIRPPALLRLLAALPVRVERREGCIYDLTCNRRDLRDETIKAWIGYARECPVSRMNFLRQLLASACCRIGDNTPQSPTLILASDRDRLVSPVCSTAIAKHWGARLHFHADAGHDLPQDDPDWVIEHIARWQAELDGAVEST